MGLCFSCRKSKLNTTKPIKVIQSNLAESTLHVCQAEQPGPERGSTAHRCINANNWFLGMANTISNMKMSNPLKGLVSKQKIRYQKDGYNLDLSYIRCNVIAMGYPAEKIEGIYRNNMDDVVKFFEHKHKDHYKIYNLCSERSYNVSKFQERVVRYPFDDHNPPKIEMIGLFCKDVDQWLKEDHKNVAAVHCKAGKGRTGVMICCYMLHTRQFSSSNALEMSNEALNYYGSKRTTNSKGVTIPSQRRYVGYYSSLIQEKLTYQPVDLVITEIHLEPAPTFNGSQGSLHVAIFKLKNKMFSSRIEVKKGLASTRICLDEYIPLQGDIKIEFFNKPKMKRKEKLFHFWFNTFFVREEVINVPEAQAANGNEDMISPPDRSTRAMSCDEQSHIPPLAATQARTSSLVSLDTDTKKLVLRLTKSELDNAHKDKQNKVYPADFKVTVFFQHVQGSMVPVDQHWTNSNSACHPNTPSESSEEGSTESDTAEDEEDGWESGESTYL